jgi:hypothetical protein
MSEKNEIRRDGAKAQKNSGRGKISKGDAQWKNFVVDYKEYGKSFSISRDSWAKICTDSMKVDRSKFPLLKLILGSGQQKTRLAVIEFAVLEELIERLESLEDG